MVALRMKKIQAATLIETIIASVIILILFGILISFFVQISVNSFSTQEMRADQILDRYIIETDEQKAFLNEEIEVEKFIIRREIIGDLKESGFVRIKFAVYTHTNKLVSDKQRFFCIK